MFVYIKYKLVIDVYLLFIWKKKMSLKIDICMKLKFC